MPIDIKRARKLLRKLDLQRLFVEELNWANPQRSPVNIQHGEQRYRLTPQAEVGGLVLFTVDKCPGDGLPDRSTRLAIHKQLLDRAQEHILVFINEARTSTLWMWVDREGGRRKAVYEHRYHVQQPGDSLLQKLEGIAFDWSDLDADGKASIIQVTDRVRAHLATERVTKRFYDEFQKQHGSFLKFIKGIEAIRDREWYASIMLNRLMFIYFIQKKGFLGGDTGYLGTRLDECRMLKMPFYDGFLKPLFFRGFACRPEERTADERKLLGEVPYLNGGLFLKHQIEEANGRIAIPDEAFRAIFEFFDRYQWHLDDRPLRADNEINPDVLGYIFEKYINQKQMGAYYTKEDITEYITKNTVLPFLFDKLRSSCWDAVVPLPVPDVEPYIHDAVKHGVDLPLPPNIATGLDDVSQRGNWNRRADGDYALPTETWREHIARRKRHQQILDDFAAGKITTINDFITYNLDIIKFTQDFLSDTQDPMVIRAFYFECLRTVTVLDPTCGSGAFLFAALNILEPLYELCLQRMEDFLARKQRHPQWAQPFEEELKRLADHPSRRYFIYKSIIVGNLYGVDIMEEAVEICKLRLFLKLVAQVEDAVHVEPLPDIDFNIRAGNTLVGYATLEEIERAKSGRFDFGGIVDRVKAVDRSIGHFRKLQTELGVSAQHFREAKENLLRELRALEVELNGDLAFEYGVKDKDLPKFVESHKPFHWYVQFYDIMAHGGFDVIIGNPPYVAHPSKDVPYEVHGYRTRPCGNLWAYCIERSLALLGRGGWTGMIVQLSLTFSRDFTELRAMLLEKRGFLRVSNFDNIPDKLFTGEKQSDNTSKQNQQRISIFLLENRPTTSPRLEMSPLVRWRTEERERLFTQLPHCDTRALCSPTSFPKVGTESMREFLRRWLHAPRCIGDLIVKDGPYSLVIPKTAGYYVAAYEDEMARTQQMLLSFGSVSDSDLALVLLNSNAYFWFWRTFGDGFHVTKGIIEGCPVFTPGDGSFRDIARALRDAIPDCTVYKGYRGKKVPNVNFNLRMDLLWQADAWIIQHVAPDLGITPLDFVWAKSNSFLSLCVPKSANWPDGCEPCDVDGEYDDDEEQ